jgi:hypothetical protein
MAILPFPLSSEIASSLHSSQRQKGGVTAFLFFPVIASPSVEGRGNSGGGVFLVIASSLHLPSPPRLLRGSAPRKDKSGVPLLLQRRIKDVAIPVVG